LPKIGHLLKNRTTFAFAICGGLFLLAAASNAAPEGTKLTSSATAKHTKAAPGAAATASLAAPANPVTDPDAGRNIVGVAAIVNDEIISDYDLRQRMGLLTATSGVRPNTDEEKKAMRAQVLRQLETELMQRQEANHKNIVISQEEADKAIDNILKENGLTLDRLKEVFAHNGVKVDTLRSQIKVQLAWQKAIEDEYGDEVRLKPSDIDSEYARMKSGANKPHYLVAEIFLGVDNPEQDAKVKADADRVAAQIHQGAPFNTIARQFSQSPTAASGGDLGTVEEGQLAPELNAAVQKLQIGQITDPIRSAGGYYILFLRRRWEPVGTKIDTSSITTVATNSTPLSRLLFPIGPKPPKQVLDNVLNVASQIREHVESCQNMDKVVASMKGVQYQELSKMGLHLSDLSEQIQAQVSKTQPGGVTLPFVSPAGVELILRCDKAAPKTEVWELPTRKDVEEQLFQEKISAMARGYLARLRRSADVRTCEDTCEGYVPAAARRKQAARDAATN
jgi:peptidyl-prolyl cis-trans isomerase SurA